MADKEKKVFTGKFEDIIIMNREQLKEHLVEYGNQEAFKKIARSKVQQKRHHTIQKPMKYDPKHPEKYNPEKMTWQKDMSRPPYYVEKPISFMEAKAEYCYQVLGFARPEKKSKTPWADDFANL